MTLIFSFLNTQPIGPATPGGITRRLAANHEKAAAAALAPLTVPVFIPLPALYLRATLAVELKPGTVVREPGAHTMNDAHIKKFARRPKRRLEVIGYCRQIADGTAVLIPARSLPVGRIPVLSQPAFRPKGG